MIIRGIPKHPRAGVAFAGRCRTSFRCAGRRYSTSSMHPNPASTPQSSASLLGTITTELDKLSPRFEIDSSRIQIIQLPSHFYETLKLKILNAKRRVYLSTLYIGKTEHDLISTVREALKRNPELKVYFLTDALRGTRETPEPSCASLLSPLVDEFGLERVEIRMFHTPNLTGLRKKVVPRRINEGWGLQHMKLYGADDELIMSGANLSTDYFTNRQDRYHLFSSAEITEYFFKVYSAVSSLSYQILPSASTPGGYDMVWPETNAGPSPLLDPKGFRQHATKVLFPLLHPTTPPSPARLAPADKATYIYPLLQFTPLLSPDNSTELPALTLLLKSLSKPDFAASKWTFTCGYFNTTPHIRRLLLATRPQSGTIIAASPQANGFYKSAGVSGMLPDAYTLLSRRFLDAVRRAGLESQIILKEWRRGTVNLPGGWSYHAKGIWLTLPGENTPSITLVGSSNYTKRSYALDLEANMLLVTADDALKARLAAEESWLQDHAKQVSREEFERPERKVGISVRIAMWVVTVLGGAL